MIPRLMRRLAVTGLSLSLLLSTSAFALTRDEAAKLVDELYVDPVPESILSLPTVEEILAALHDPYTRYFTAEEYDFFQASMNDSSDVGIGISAKQGDGGLIVQDVFPDSSAEAGGLKRGDIIIKVDDTSIAGMEINDAIAMIKGPDGTSVKIDFSRNGIVQSVSLTRAAFVVPTVTANLLDGHIGYLKCTSFGSETAQHFREGILAYRDQVNAWIVDLRGNGGGYTSAAIDSAAYFADAGTSAYLRGRSGGYSVYSSKEESLTLFPVIVLMDMESASSSELFASIIRDRGVGIVVGSRSFGKGVAQSLCDKDTAPELFPDGDALKITSHRFFSVDGNTTDQIGIIPDLAISPKYALDVARLLCGRVPYDGSMGYLRIGNRWLWDISIEQAMQPENKDTFITLLNAIDPRDELQFREAGSSQWVPCTLNDVAERFHISLTPTEFHDIGDSRYQNHVRTLRHACLLKGYEDNSFRPQGNMTRAELCHMLASALGCFVPDVPSGYTDIAEDAWYKPAVTALTKLGLVNGVGGGRFDPEGTVDHQQFITIMGRMAAWMNMGFYNALQSMPEGALDIVAYMDYSPWAKSSLWLLSNSQRNILGTPISMLWDKPSEISPLAPTTRDEAAYTLCTILNFTGILPE